MRLHQLHCFLSGIPPVSEVRHFHSRSLRPRSLRTRSRLYIHVHMRMLPVAYWERDVRILSTSIQTCSMGTICRNPEYEVDGRTTTITAIIHTYIQRNSPFTTLVWGSLRLAPITTRVWPGSASIARRTVRNELLATTLRKMQTFSYHFWCDLRAFFLCTPCVVWHSRTFANRMGIR